MNARRLLRIGLALGMLAGPGAGRAFALGFTNGSFEAPGLADATFSTYTAGTGPTGWVLGNGNASLNNNGARGRGNAFSGEQYLLLPESVTQAGISQTVTGLTPGVVYKFSFRAAVFNNTASTGSCYLRIGNTSSGGSPFMGIFLSAPANSTVLGSATSPWTLYAQTFTATIGSEEFEFYTLREPPDNAFAAIDDVRLDYGFNGFPSVRIESPDKTDKKTLTTTKPKITVAGTATSRIPLQSVTVRVGARRITARGTSIWLAKVPLKRGKNRIAVTTVDAAGYASQPKTLTVTRERK